MDRMTLGALNQNVDTHSLEAEDVSMIKDRSLSFSWVSDLLQSEITQPTVILKTRIEKIAKEVVSPDVKRALQLAMDEVHRVQEGIQALQIPHERFVSRAQLEEVCLLRCLEMALLFFRVRAVEENVSVEVEVEENQIVYTDIFLFQQLLLNILELYFDSLKTGAGDAVPRTISFRYQQEPSLCLVISGSGWDKEFIHLKANSSGEGSKNDRLIVMNKTLSSMLGLKLQSRLSDRGNDLIICFERS